MCEDLLDRQERRTADHIFQSRDMRIISSPPGMYADSLRRPTRLLPRIECREVAAVYSIAHAFAAITAVSFDIPFSVARAVYQPEQAFAGEYRGFLGLVGVVPVAIVAIVAWRPVCWACIRWALCRSIVVTDTARPYYARRSSSCAPAPASNTSSCNRQKRVTRSTAGWDFVTSRSFRCG